jgi:hypothetical protein
MVTRSVKGDSNLRKTALFGRTNLEYDDARCPSPAVVNRHQLKVPKHCPSCSQVIPFAQYLYLTPSNEQKVMLGANN